MKNTERHVWDPRKILWRVLGLDKVLEPIKNKKCAQACYLNSSMLGTKYTPDPEHVALRTRPRAQKDGTPAGQHTQPSFGCTPIT